MDRLENPETIFVVRKGEINMPLISAKCTNCGANLEVDNTKEAAICPYCNTAYVVEKAVNYYNTTNNITADVVNVYGGNSADFVIRAGELVKYNGASTEVYIPNTVKMIGDNAFSGCSGLEKVTIPEGVTKIGSHAFWGCAGLTEVIIPDSVTEIGMSVFSDCTLLHRVAMSKNVTRIPDWAFQRCRHLESFEIPYGVKSIGNGAFEYSGLKKITIPDTVESLGWGAFNCALDSICIPDGVVPSRYVFMAGGNEDYVENNIGHIEASEDWKRKYYYVSKLLECYKPVETKQSGCYIATAVYGSYDCPQVWTLRRFRDNTLAAAWYGRAFIRIYYAVSPSLVKLFGHTNWFKKLWRGRLDDMVEKLQQRGVESSPYCDRPW